MSDNPTASKPTLRFFEGILQLEGWEGDPGKTLGIAWRWHQETSCWVAHAAKYREINKAGLDDRVPDWQSLEPLHEANLHVPRGAQQKAIAAWKKAGFGMVWMADHVRETFARVVALCDSLRHHSLEDHLTLAEVRRVIALRSV